MTTPPPVASPETAEALRMLAVFASVGADAFDITHTNLDEEKRGFRLAQARASLPYLVPSSIQLDDITPENLSRIAPVAFLTLQTSRY